jgi:ribosomal protein S18 acetylase RimI-like enzyme
MKNSFKFIALMIGMWGQLNAGISYEWAVPANFMAEQQLYAKSFYEVYKTVPLAVISATHADVPFEKLDLPDRKADETCETYLTDAKKLSTWLDAAARFRIDVMGRRFKSANRPCNNALYRAHDKGKLLGFANYNATEFKDTVHLGIIAVDPTVQGQGIGTKLINGLFEKYSHVNRIVLIVRAFNKQAQAFYKKLGFKDSYYWPDRETLISQGRMPLEFVKKPLSQDDITYEWVTAQKIKDKQLTQEAAIMLKAFKRMCRAADSFETLKQAYSDILQDSPRLGTRLEGITDRNQWVETLYKEYLADSITLLQTNPSSAQWCMLRAFSDKKLIGFSIFHGEENSTTKKLYMIAIDPEVQAKGVGKKLALSLLDKDPAVKRIILSGRAFNPACGFYKKIGFKPIKAEELKNGVAWFEYTRQAQQA